MRIWMINHYAAPPTMAGGTRHYNFARQLMQRGHEVLLIAANYNHFSQKFIQTPTKMGEIDHSYDVPFVWIPTPAYQGNTAARFKNMLAFSLRALRKKYLSRTLPPDIIIGSSPHLFAALSGELLAKRLNVPFILEVRDLWPESLVDLGRISTHHPLIKLMKGVESYLYKRANRVISLLPSADKYLIMHGVKPENIVWLPNAIDTDIIPIDLKPMQKSDLFTVMYAGAHGIANDLDTVLSAAKILQDKYAAQQIRICLIGDGQEKTRLKELAVTLNVSMVEFCDPVSKTEIYPILNQADAFLMLLKDSPVFRFGISPNKLFDYLAMGRPVIFGVETPFNPIKEFNAGITIKPSDPESLASAIYHLSLVPKSELANMGERGKNFVLHNHHIQKLTDSLENLITDTIKEVGKSY
jgi:glycosyltransferase involved in cell wall biosynthesis